MLKRKMKPQTLHAKSLTSANHSFIVGLQLFHPHTHSQDVFSKLLNILVLKLEFISRNRLRFSLSFSWNFVPFILWIADHFGSCNFFGSDVFPFSIIFCIIIVDFAFLNFQFTQSIGLISTFYMVVSSYSLTLVS